MPTSDSDPDPDPQRQAPDPDDPIHNCRRVIMAPIRRTRTNLEAWEPIHRLSQFTMFGI